MDGEIAAALVTLEAERQRLDALCKVGPAPTDAALLAARNHIAEAIGALKEMSEPAPAPVMRGLADRIVLIDPAVTTEGFRTRVKLKNAEPPPAPTPPPAPVPAGDDLTRIRGIDATLAAKLAAAGVSSFAAIADWARDDVRQISDSLGLGRQISRQNWIEQAALLRGSAMPAASPPEPTVADSPTAIEIAAPPREPEPVAVPATYPIEPVVQAIPAEPDRFDLIAGIDADLADALVGGGIRRWSDIAGWRRADIAVAEERLALKTSISRQGWIEQAAILASGRLTAHAARALAGDFSCLVARPTPEPLPPPAFVDWQSLPIEAASEVAADEAKSSVTTELVPAPVASAHAAEPSPTFALETSVEPPAEPAPTVVPQALPVVEAAPAETSLAARVNNLELELAALVANDKTADPVLAPPVTAPPPALESGLHIEDEEFPELNVGEADVVIVPAKPAPVAPVTVRPSPTTGRNLLARLRRPSALDDIDSRSYAAYRDRVEEASVEIIKPAATAKDAGDMPSIPRRLGPSTHKS